ncbi:MAG: hypothetical protein ACE5K2_05775, partial [Candidatus Zixiibacteriota bacterium]
AGGGERVTLVRGAPTPNQICCRVRVPPQQWNSKAGVSGFSLTKGLPEGRHSRALLGSEGRS